MKNVEELKAGEVLLVSAKRINGGKVSLCFAEKIKNPNSRPSSITGLLNKSDDRFTQSGSARYAWMSGEESDIKALFGFGCEDIPNVGDEKDLGILNPQIDSEKLSIQITETTDGNEYEVANFDTVAKRAGKDGEFILSEDGKYIYMRATVVLGDAKHVFLANTKRPSASASSADEAVEDAIS